jgi:NitT/TauT family transport system ATP-binding protein
MPTKNNFLQLNAATFAYEGTFGDVVSSIDWSIPEGGIHCLVGRSGCGKTTLLKLAAGLLQPISGSVRVLGSDVAEPSKHVGFVFQSPSLLEWQTVLNNVLLPISLHGNVTTEDQAAARELIKLVGLQEHIDRYPTQLSGGQQSRVALARALITKPEGLLMDEPFAALDAITREELQDDLLQLVSLRQTTVLFVTHDIGEAVYLADKVAVMRAGEIVCSADVTLSRPRNQTQRYSSVFNATCLKLRNAMAPKTGADG